MDASESPYLYLTTKGRHSGRPHEIEIWYVAYHDCYYLVSEKREHADWVRNIQRTSAVRFRVDAVHFDGRGRAVDAAQEPELAAAIRQLMDSKYGWSDGLIVELQPEQ